MLNFTAEEIDRIRLIIKMMRRKLAIGLWSLNGEEITLADVALLQRIVDSAEGGGVIILASTTWTPTP